MCEDRGALKKVCVKGAKLLRCVVKAVERQKLHSEGKALETCAKGSKSPRGVWGKINQPELSPTGTNPRVRCRYPSFLNRKRDTLVQIIKTI